MFLNPALSNYALFYRSENFCIFSFSGDISTANVLGSVICGSDIHISASLTQLKFNNTQGYKQYL